MHSFRSALVEAFGGTEAFEKRLKEARFESAVERGRQLLLNATKATIAGSARTALVEVWKDRYACAAYIAAELSKERKRFVSIRVGYAELQRMEQLWQAEMREQDALAPSRNGKPTEARIAS